MRVGVEVVRWRYAARPALADAFPLEVPTPFHTATLIAAQSDTAAAERWTAEVDQGGEPR